jgi:UDP-N-acetyl-D-mannosaminuronic acid dehydrogenase
VLIRAARGVNDGKPGHVIKAIEQSMREFSKPRIACLGLAFKANIDDLRESPALSIVEILAQRGIDILAVEPFIDTLPRALAGRANVKLVDIESALEQADIVVGLVDHEQFKKIDRKKLERKIVIDTRGIWQ